MLMQENNFEKKMKSFKHDPSNKCIIFWKTSIVKSCPDRAYGQVPLLLPFPLFLKLSLPCSISISITSVQIKNINAWLNSFDNEPQSKPLFLKNGSHLVFHLLNYLRPLSNRLLCNNTALQL